MQRELLQEVEDSKFLAALPDRFDGATVSALRARVNSQLPLLLVQSESRD
jgi:hypothetical protein